MRSLLHSETNLATRSSAVNSIVNNYYEMLNSMNFAVIYGTSIITASLSLLQCSDGLNRSLQCPKVALPDKLKSVHTTIKNVHLMRSEEKFKEIFTYPYKKLTNKC